MCEKSLDLTSSFNKMAAAAAAALQDLTVQVLVASLFLDAFDETIWSSC